MCSSLKFVYSDPFLLNSDKEFISGERVIASLILREQKLVGILQHSPTPCLGDRKHLQDLSSLPFSSYVIRSGCLSH